MGCGKSLRYLGRGPGDTKSPAGYWPPLSTTGDFVLASSFSTLFQLQTIRGDSSSSSDPIHRCNSNLCMTAPETGLQDRTEQRLVDGGYAPNSYERLPPTTFKMSNTPPSPPTQRMPSITDRAHRRHIQQYYIHERASSQHLSARSINLTSIIPPPSHTSLNNNSDLPRQAI